MTHSRVFVIPIVAALAATPLVQATWSAYGSQEPDTPFDSSSFMWSDPPGGAVRVYFNAYTTSGPGGIAGVNPNVGLLGSRVESMVTENHFAILGIWTDCNGDGYVGLAETAAREYPSSLLLGSAVCPAASSPSTTCWTAVGPGQPCPNWPARGFNNFNGWVNELIPITGPNARTSGDNIRIRDPLAAVWGDFGKPHEPSSESDGGTCAITPLPRGTTRSTGGLLSYADCSTGVLEAWNLVWADTIRVAGVDLPGAGDPLGLRFADDDDGTTGALGRLPTLGEPGGAPIVKAMDCGQPVLVPFGEPGQGIRPPSTEVNPSGSVAGTVNYTFEAAPIPTRPSNAQSDPETADCDPSNDRGDEPYTILEGDEIGVDVEGKAASDYNFVPVVGTRGGAPFGVVTAGGAGAPNDLGLTIVSAVCAICGHTEWSGSVNLVKGTPQTVEMRGTIADGDLGVDVDDAYWMSYYAVVGPAVTGVAALPGGVGTYGGTQCGGATSGIRNGWNCNAAEWNRNPDGTPIDNPNGWLSYPGRSYNLRDVDCYDGNLGLGLGVQPAFFGPAPC